MGQGHTAGAARQPTPSPSLSREGDSAGNGPSFLPSLFREGPGVGIAEALGGFLVCSWQGVNSHFGGGLAYMGVVTPRPH